jgi:hypothetical protein
MNTERVIVKVLWRGDIFFCHHTEELRNSLSYSFLKCEKTSLLSRVRIMIVWPPDHSPLGDTSQSDIFSSWISINNISHSLRDTLPTLCLSEIIKLERRTRRRLCGQEGYEEASMLSTSQRHIKYCFSFFSKRKVLSHIYDYTL